MHTADHRLRVFAVLLSGLAGYVDAIGFLSTGGFFVSFMSGNTTRLGIGLAVGSREAAMAAGLVGSFVAGVSLGAALGRFSGALRRPAILSLVGGLLALSALLARRGAATLAPWPMVMAMGAENTVFAQQGEVRIGLTYMTGALVKLGKGLTAALFGEAPFGWTPHALLWSGLLAGAVTGAMAYGRIGSDALWLAAAAMGVLALAAFRVTALR